MARMQGSKKIILVEKIAISDFHGVWKLQKKSHKLWRAKRATFTFSMGKNWWKMPKLKNDNFSDFHNFFFLFFSAAKIRWSVTRVLQWDRDILNRGRKFSKDPLMVSHKLIFKEQFLGCKLLQFFRRDFCFALLKLLFFIFSTFFNFFFSSFLSIYFISRKKFQSCLSSFSQNNYKIKLAINAIND